jgi:hypothetical protein
MAFFLFLIFTILSYLRVLDYYPDAAQFRVMLILGLFALAVSTVTMVMRQRASLRRPQVLLMTGFVVAIALSHISKRWFGGAYYSLADFGTAMALFFLAVVNIDTLKRLRILSVVLVLIMLVIVIQGALAYHLGINQKVFTILQWAGDPGNLDNMHPDDIQAVLERTGVRRIRGEGFLNDPNDLGQALVMVMPFLALAWRSGRIYQNFFLVIIPGSILFYGLFLTHSRGALVGLGVIVFLATFKKEGKWRLISLVLMGGLVLSAAAFSGGREYSAQESSAAGRFEAWSDGLQMLRQQPVFGVGYNSFLDYHPELTAHNSFVLCFAELGMTGYMLWIALLLVTAAEVLIVSKIPGDDEDSELFRHWAKALQLAFFGYLVCAWFLSRTYSPTLYLLIGMLTAFCHIVQEEREDEPVPEYSLFGWSARTGALAVASIAAVYVSVRLQHVLRALGAAK